MPKIILVMEEKSFFYIDSYGVQQGPRTVRQLEGEYVIMRDTMVWCQGMTDWRRASEVDELREICDSRPPVLEVPQMRNEPRMERNYQPTELCPHTWLIESILSALFCCIVTGVVGIIYASKVEGLWSSGRYGEARSAANTAKTWFIVGTALSLVLIVIYLILMAMAILPFGMMSFM